MTARKTTIEPFYLVVIDRDRKQFNLIGPITDDTAWNKRVCDAQDKKREVNCHSASPAQTREQIIASESAQGYSYTDLPLV